MSTPRGLRKPGPSPLAILLPALLGVMALSFGALAVTRGKTTAGAVLMTVGIALIAAAGISGWRVSR